MENERSTTDIEIVLTRLADKLFGFELVEYLGITTEEIIEAFRERVTDILDELEDEFLD